MLFRSNQGIPVAQVAPSSPLSRALADLAVRLVPQLAPTHEVRPRAGWLRQLFAGTSASPLSPPPPRSPS